MSSEHAILQLLLACYLAFLSVANNLEIKIMVYCIRIWLNLFHNGSICRVFVSDFCHFFVAFVTKFVCKCCWSRSGIVWEEIVERLCKTMSECEDLNVSHRSVTTKRVKPNGEAQKISIIYNSEHLLQQILYTLSRQLCIRVRPIAIVTECNWPL